MTTPAVRPPPSPRVRGRRIAIGIYWTIVVLFSLVPAVQVTQQVLFDPAPAAPYPTCHDGLRALFSAVTRAREVAAGSEGDENRALSLFRKALEPEWKYRDGVAALCQASGANVRDAGTLDAIERLRYAEEHAVRREAGELAPLRKKVQTIVDHELGP
jgi:hypothetical protein